MTHRNSRTGSAVRAVIIVLAALVVIPFVLVGLLLLSYRATRVTAEEARFAEVRAREQAQEALIALQPPGQFNNATLPTKQLAPQGQANGDAMPVFDENSNGWVDARRSDTPLEPKFGRALPGQQSNPGSTLKSATNFSSESSAAPRRQTPTNSQARFDSFTPVPNATPSGTAFGSNQTGRAKADNNISKSQAFGSSTLRPEFRTVYQRESRAEMYPVTDPKTGKVQMRQRVVERMVPRTETSYVQVSRSNHPHDSEIMELVRQLRENKDGDSSDEKMDELRQRLELEFTQMHKRQAKEIREVEERLAKLKSLHDLRDEKRENIIERRIDELLGKTDGLQWQVNSSPSRNPAVSTLSLPTSPPGYSPQLSASIGLAGPLRIPKGAPSDFQAPNAASGSHASQESPKTPPVASANRNIRALGATAPVVTPGYLQPPLATIGNSIATAPSPYAPNQDRLSNQQPLSTYSTGPRPAEPQVGRVSEGMLQQPTPARNNFNSIQSRLPVKAPTNPTTSTLTGQVFQLARQLASAKSELEIAEMELMDIRKLHARGVVPKSELFKAESKLLVLQSQLDLSKAELEELENRIEREVKFAQNSIQDANESEAEITARFGRQAITAEKFAERSRERNRIHRAYEEAKANLEQFQRAMKLVERQEVSDATNSNSATSSESGSQFDEEPARGTDAEAPVQEVEFFQGSDLSRETRITNIDSDNNNASTVSDAATNDPASDDAHADDQESEDARSEDRESDETEEANSPLQTDSNADRDAELLGGGGDAGLETTDPVDVSGSELESELAPQSN